MKTTTREAIEAKLVSGKHYFLTDVFAWFEVRNSDEYWSAAESMTVPGKEIIPAVRAMLADGVIVGDYLSFRAA